MRFLHPEFLYLAPLISVPILIHLLNRIRYRRQRWAAIDFLLRTERRAVRRARLRQLLLMALRALLLTAALGAFAQPMLGGSVAALVGGSSQVAVVLDTSASMSAADASGGAFERGREMAIAALDSLPRSASAAAGTLSSRYDSPFRSPVRDRAAVRSVLKSAALTGGAADFAAGIRAAAGSLEESGGGAVLLVTDMQAAGWHASDSGAWEDARRALERAGRPRVVVCDVSPKTGFNLAVVALTVEPAVLVKGDSPKVTATVRRHGGGSGAAEVSLFFEGQRVDSRTVEFAGPGSAQVVFRLPAVQEGAHTGCVQVGPDTVPADDRYHFLVRPAERIPVVVVDGVPSARPFDGAADFLVLALEPQDGRVRSPFAVKKVTMEEFRTLSLGNPAAVLLADVPQLDGGSTAVLRDYVNAGGLVVIFPGAHTDQAAWSGAGFPGVAIRPAVVAEGDKRFKVAWTSPTNSVVATLPAEGLGLLKLTRVFKLDEAPGGNVLARTEDGSPFLVSRQVGKGKLYAFAVSCQVDFSNLPLSPVFLPVIHRMVLQHLIEAAPPPAGTVLTELTLRPPPGAWSILTPDGRALPLSARDSRPGEAFFDRTEMPGVYSLVAGAVAPGVSPQSTPIAALNVPPEESSLERIEPDTVRGLLQGHPVGFVTAHGGEAALAEGSGGGGAAAAFPLAALAFLLFFGEVALAWHLDKPSSSAAPAGTNHSSAGRTCG